MVKKKVGDEACDVPTRQRYPSLVGWTNGERVSASALLVTNNGPNKRVALIKLARSTLFACHTQTGSYVTLTRERSFLLTLDMSETAVDAIDFFSDLFADEDDFNAPSGESGVHSSVQDDDRWNDVLDMDDSDTDIIFRFDGQGTDITRIEALGEDIIPRTVANGQDTTSAGSTDFF